MPAPASKNSPSPTSHSAPKVALLKSSTSNSSGSQADVLSMQRFAFSTSPSTRESAPRSAKYPMLKLTAWSCAEAGTAAASAAVSPRPVTIDRHMGVLLVINGACGPVPPPNPAVGAERMSVRGARQMPLPGGKTPALREGVAVVCRRWGSERPLSSTLGRVSGDRREHLVVHAPVRGDQPTGSEHEWTAIQVRDAAPCFFDEQSPRGDVPRPEAALPEPFHPPGRHVAHVERRGPEATHRPRGRDEFPEQPEHLLRLFVDGVREPSDEQRVHQPIVRRYREWLAVQPRAAAAVRREQLVAGRVVHGRDRHGAVD